MKKFLPEPRPMRHLRIYANRYPNAWNEYKKFTASKGKNGLDDWPNWCFCPLAAAYAIITKGSQKPADPTIINNISVLGALAAWRMTRTIYRFDPVLFQALIETKPASLPLSVLYRLPEWCVYVETSGFDLGGDEIHGFYAHLEYDVNTGREEIRFVLDMTTTDESIFLVGLPMHMGKTVRDGMESMLKEERRQRQKQKIPLASDEPENLIEILVNSAAPLLALLIYLCSEKPNYSRQPPGNPQPRKTKRGFKIFPASSTTTIAVGNKLGTAITRAKAENHESTGQPEPGGRKSQIPHIRRAHWHSYWTGSRGNQTLIVKWLSPIAVNLDTTATDNVSTS